MAEMTGKLAKVYLNNTLISGSHNWSIDDSSELQDATGFADEGHSRYKAGNDGWTGTVELNYDSAQNIRDVAGANVNKGAELTTNKFYVDATHYITGTIMIESVGIAVPQKTLISQTVRFRGQGAIDYTNL